MNEVEWYAVTPPCSHDELLAAVRVYARDLVSHHDLSVDVSDLQWSVSTRAKRRAGLLRYRDDTPLEVRLAWRLFESQGWHAVASTVRIAPDAPNARPRWRPHSIAVTRSAALPSSDVRYGDASRRTRPSDIRYSLFRAPSYWFSGRVTQSLCVVSTSYM
ncbi:hypothetical protein [Salarchaeum sp. JOR-1]|uniref:hypothetical protein n=1 Tax=Salarchaeum sp. JOR-1 TaxID=2599399 RepID=UPI0011984C5B|nr:hypothetical protein [Salarchaeum sp. JOR-1]QDX39898.1 hypothetical protein FQU85_02910 [Salarchaeum sp. JOR-1]